MGHVNQVATNDIQKSSEDGAFHDCCFLIAASIVRKRKMRFDARLEEFGGKKIPDRGDSIVAHLDTLIILFILSQAYAHLCKLSIHEVECAPNSFTPFERFGLIVGVSCQKQSPFAIVGRVPSQSPLFAPSLPRCELACP